MSVITVEEIEVHKADNPREVLAETFRRRSFEALEQLSCTASLQALSVALSAPTNIGGVASLLSDLAPLGVDLSTIDPLAEAMARGAAIKQELLQKAGGALSSTQVAQALGITRQGVDKRRTRHALLAVPSGSGDYLYPACQFTPDGVVPHFDEVLHAFQVAGPWTQLSVLLSPSPALNGKTIIDALHRNNVKQAVAVATAFGEQGA
ncbi:MAG: DNA-binding protein [Acidobacteriota bacterium]|nr:DNA-binding protein [Acidobacteriota bacterium]